MGQGLYDSAGTLFQGKVILGASSGKPAMPRLPLHSTFSCRAESAPFDFHLVGVHLKSQRGDGSDQREAAAKRLARWITQETWDTDAIIAGDWNAPPNRSEWASIRQLEDGEKLRFAAWNDDEPSHFMKSGRGSKLDLVVVTESAAEAAVGGGAKVIPWKDVETQHLLVEAIDMISDHRPVLSRFYFSKE